ncbi:putative general amidase GmdA [Lineolata rhizophorae]|uniref:amidase n=1 Tax=Lineolata rhizophorae TaxID=578093 RepID=A0A6A6NPU8_9PEZI|nr:putative general amidase GmdA [Lineolata rhizophorae]
MDWKTQAKLKRESVTALIPKEWILDSIPSPSEQRDVTGDYIRKFLSDEEIEITETDAFEIVQNTSQGTWTAVEVTSAFCHRAAIAHQLTNCLHEIFFDDALSSAKRLDAHFSEHKKPMGPLHGLPISLKDQFHVRGVETTMGYVGWIGTFQGLKGTDKEKVFESEMVRELRQLGAVLFVKTSVPHTLMCGETVNNIIGYTWNPANRFLSSGGSSGGEGALIALRGSPVGFGTDIGGSIRIPAAFNGIFGLKPSSGRLPYEGMANSMDGQNSILSVVGPLATSIRSLRLVTKALLGAEPWMYDPLVLEMPWRVEQEERARDRKLVFGVYRDDGVVRPTPPVRRAIDHTAQRMRDLGHEVIEWTPPPHEDLYPITMKTFFFDGGQDVHSAFGLASETPSEQLLGMIGQEPGPQSTGSEIAAVNVTKREMQKAYLDYWNSTASQTPSKRMVDAIIAPVSQFPAARPNKYGHYGYTIWANLLDLTAVVIPVLRARKDIDVVDAGYKPRNDSDRQAYESYDPEVYDGAHVGLQLVGHRLQEEKMLAIAEYVHGALASGDVTA